MKAEAAANWKAWGLEPKVVLGGTLQWVLKLDRSVSSRKAMCALPRNLAFSPHELKRH